MKTYKIIARTNGYIASRDIRFNGRTTYVVLCHLTLKDAQRKLLEMFNHDYDNEIGMPFRNWGLARINRPDVTNSFPDGTRSYEYDSRYYSIERERKAVIKTYQTNADLFLPDGTIERIDWDGLEFDNDAGYNEWISEQLKSANACDNYDEIRTQLEIVTDYLRK